MTHNHVQGYEKGQWGVSTASNFKHANCVLMKETICMFSCVFFIKEFLDLLERHNALKSDFWAANMIYIFGIQMKKIYSIQKKIESLSKDLFNIYMCYISMFLFTIIHILWCNIFGSIVNRGNGKGLSEGNISADCLLDVMVKFVYVCMLW